MEYSEQNPSARRREGETVGTGGGDQVCFVKAKRRGGERRPPPRKKKFPLKTKKGTQVCHPERRKRKGGYRRCAKYKINPRRAREILHFNVERGKKKPKTS